MMLGIFHKKGKITMRKLEQPPASTQSRHYGLDLLKILSMLMVLSVHIFSIGEIRNNTVPFSANYFCAWTTEIANYCCVNCYAMITGYVFLNGKYRYTNLAMLWLQVALYSVLGTAIFYFAFPGSVTNLELLRSAFPVSMRHFWFFSAYFAMFLMIPFMNRAIHAMTRKQAKVLCAALLVLFSVTPVFMYFDPYGAYNGYSAIWLMVMYILGACIRKFDFGARIPSWVLVMSNVLAVAFGVGLHMLYRSETIPLLSRIMTNASVMSQTFPGIVVCGISWMLLFTRVRVTSPKLITLVKLLSPLTFGIYIIHTQEQVSDLIFRKLPLRDLASYPTVLMMAAVFLTVTVLFIVCAAIDKLRLTLFQALKLKQRLLKLEEKFIGPLWDKGQ